MGSGGTGVGIRETEILAELVRMDEGLEALEEVVSELEIRFENVLTPSNPISKAAEEPSRQTGLGANLQSKNRRLQNTIDAIRNIQSRCEL